MKIKFVVVLSVATYWWPGTLVALPVRFENFDTDPGWMSAANGVSDNDFGYKLSANAGGAIGEAGGRFVRTAQTRFYADTDIDGVLTLDEPITASGKFDHTDTVIPDFGVPFFIGHFDSATDTPGRFGISFSNNGTSSLQWRALIEFDDGTTASSTTHNAIGTNVDREWFYTWDPLGGVNGGGLLTVSLSGPGGGTKLVDITLSQRSVGTTTNAFGFNSLPATTTENSFFADMYIDDVTYTIVPEPSGAVLWGIGTTALFAIACRRRRPLKRIAE